MDELTVLGYFYTLQIRNEKKEKSSSCLLFLLLYVHWESGAGFSCVASLFSRLRFINRITSLTFLILNRGDWLLVLLVSVGFGLSQSRP